MTSDDQEFLCVGGLQHAFAMTAWEQAGAESFWVTELLCPTCGTTANRGGDSADWAGTTPAPEHVTQVRGAAA